MIANATVAGSLVASAGVPVQLTSLDSERTDLLSCWKLVFERTPAVGVSEDGSPTERSTDHSQDEVLAAAVAGLMPAHLALRTEPVEFESAKSRRVDAQPVATDKDQPAAESVNVLLSGASVAVVVRDATLSEVRALRAAFEAAHELTGKRSALEQLVLNGRTLYRQPAPARTGNVAGTVFFAC